MKSKLIAVLSPAKLMQQGYSPSKFPVQIPALIEQAAMVNDALKKLKSQEISKLLAISEKLTIETLDKIHSWGLPFTKDNATPSILLFKGEVYRGLGADEWKEDQILYSDNCIRILSGLYGYLRPLDLIQPYRLMMGTPFSPQKNSKNLYEFWRNDITEALLKDLKTGDTLVNLASQEYFKVIDRSKITNRIITCEFKERKGQKLTVVSTFAKQARGRMARFIVENKINSPEQMLDFDADGYQFSNKESNEECYVFIR